MLFRCRMFPQQCMLTAYSVRPTWMTKFSHCWLAWAIRRISCALRAAASISMIVLYTREQIDDLRLLCSRESPVAICSVLSVDRTFNLSSLFITVMVFKNKKVVRCTSQEPPIFVGPIMLYGDGKLKQPTSTFSLLLVGHWMASLLILASLRVMVWCWDLMKNRLWLMLHI